MAFARIAPLSAADLIVTDTDIDAGHRQAISAGAALHIA
jgi:hypothetical protein